MRISQNGLAKTKRHEGLRLRAYPDPGSRDGKPWTIGYGHTRGVKRGDQITAAEASAFLRQDIRRAEKDVNRYVTVDLTQGQFDALTSWQYNTGALKGSTLLRVLNEGRYKRATKEMMRWVHNDGKKMAGLVRRRKAEVKLFNSGSRTLAAVGKGGLATTVLAGMEVARTVDVDLVKEAAPTFGVYAPYIIGGLIIVAFAVAGYAFLQIMLAKKDDRQELDAMEDDWEEEIYDV